MELKKVKNILENLCQYFDLLYVEKKVSKNP